MTVSTGRTGTRDDRNMRLASRDAARRSINQALVA